MVNEKHLGKQSLSIFLLALLLFTLGIWDQTAQGFDGRWWLFLEEMFRHGPGFFATTYGEPYPDYPGTATFLSYLFARLLGAPNHLANVLPTALASTGVLAMIYRLLAPSSRTWALLTVLLTALTTQLLEKSRSVCLDQMTSLLCLVCFYLLHTGERLGSKLRQYAVFPLFALGFVIRGPLGLIEVCGVACVYWAMGVSRSRAETLQIVRRVLGYGVVGLLLLAAGWWALISLARLSGGEDFAKQVYTMQIGGRLGESGEPFYFYLQLSLYRYFPVVPLALATLIALRHKWSLRDRDSEVQLVLRLGACGLMILLGLSVPHFKRAYYILPMVPMFAAVAAYGLLHAQGWLVGVRRFYSGLVALLPGLGIIVVFVLRHTWLKHGFWPQVSLPLLVGALVVLQVIAANLWLKPSGELGRRLVLLSLIALATQWLLLVKVVEPAQDLEFDTRGFVEPVERLRAVNPGPLVFLDMGQDTWAVRYVMNLDHDEKPLFVAGKDAARLDSLPRPAWVILSRKEQALLAGSSLEKATPAFEGRFNGNPCLVFELK